MPFMDYSLVQELRQQLDGTQADITSLGSADYTESTRPWSETCKSDAGAVVSPTCTSEVSLVVTFARDHHVEFVVRGGGYSTGGESATQGGIVISLDRMRGVSVDSRSQTVRVQGGARWDDVNRATAPYGLAVVGATASQTGVGGSTLGGGYGWLTGRYGLIVDSLVRATVVLANGSVLEASEEAHRDLFWAIRGAGQAFGVVTELEFRAHRLPDQVFGGLLYFKASKLFRVIDFANWFHEQQDKDSGLFFGFRAAPKSADDSVIMAVLFYNGPQERATAFFAPLLSLDPVINRTGMMPYWQLARQANVRFDRRRSRKSGGGTKLRFPPDKDLIPVLWRDFDQVMQEFPQMGDSVLAIELLPFAKLMSVPVEATACANRDCLYNVGLLLCWHDPRLDAFIDRYRQATLTNIQNSQCWAQVAEGGVAAYPNYAGHDFATSYLFGRNLPRLQQLKKIYDPYNAFRKWQNLLSSPT
ncbi:hypothetical protein BDW67DRAFT_173889 [Aspergillus spinulosporus]